MRTSTARSAKTLYPASLIFLRRSSSVVIRSGSTEWMRKGSMIVLNRSGIAAPMLGRRFFTHPGSDPHRLRFGSAVAATVS
jgi:hypothetical protein